MEVHHSHGLTHKKKWSEYLLEFLMLFFAVYLGFLAENIREHKIEKERAKQYIESFYEDIKADTARINAGVDFDDAKLLRLSSINLSDCYDTISKTMRGSSCLFDMINASALNRPLKMTTRTLNQLANAGGFRLLKKEDADSIAAYQKECDNLDDFQSTVYQQAQDIVRLTFNQLVNFKANAQMFKPEGSRLIMTTNYNDVTNPLLFSEDKTLLNRYFNELQLYYRITYNHKRFLLRIKEYQIRLIDFFKDKYHFE